MKSNRLSYDELLVSSPMENSLQSFFFILPLMITTETKFIACYDHNNGNICVHEVST